MNRYFIRYPEFRKKALTLSYDDGVEQDIRLIRNMDQYGIKGTFNLNSGTNAGKKQEPPYSAGGGAEAI